MKVAVSSPVARGHRWTQKGCGMAVPAEATVPVGADARRFPRVGGWAGWGHIETPADVARLLSAANHAGTPRAGTEQMARLVDTATSVMPGNLDATRVLPVAAELADLLPWPGLVRGAAIAAVGSGSLLLTLLGGAVRDGGWAAVVGLPELGAAAAPEYTVELSRLALVPAPGPDWPTVVAALIDGLDLVAVATPAEMAPGMARVLMARARQRGCVLVTTRPWPGCDLILEAGEHRWRGLGHGRGRLRVHEVRLTACGRGAMVRPTTTCVELPPSSPDRRQASARTTRPNCSTRPRTRSPSRRAPPVWTSLAPHRRASATEGGWRGPAVKTTPAGVRHQRSTGTQSTTPTDSAAA